MDHPNNIIVIKLSTKKGTDRTAAEGTYTVDFSKLFDFEKGEEKKVVGTFKVRITTTAVNYSE